MDDDSGWVRLHRKTLENLTFQRDPTAWRLFTVLLLKADYRTGKLTAGRHQLAEWAKDNGSTTWKALLRLEKDRMVDKSSNNRYTTISICNWEKYQSPKDNSKDNSKEFTRTTGGQREDTLQELRIKHEETTQGDVTATPQRPDRGSIILGMKLETRQAWDCWENNFSEITTSLEDNRSALNKLLELEGSPDKLCRLIELADRAWKEEYVPKAAKASSPKELWVKRSALLAWGKGKFAQSTSNKAI